MAESRKFFVSLIVLCGLITGLHAADTSAPPVKVGERPEARRPLRDMSPEERQARFKEMEERFGPAPFTLDDLRKMTPEERQTKMRQWREGRFNFSTEERQRRRGQIRQRLTRQIGELQKKKADGTISEEERGRLERFEMIASRFDRMSRLATNSPSGGKPATNVPSEKGK
jgi:hypothetical protein